MGLKVQILIDGGKSIQPEDSAPIHYIDFSVGFFEMYIENGVIIPNPNTDTGARSPF